MIFSCVFKTFSWTSFFSIFWRLGAKRVDFGSPLAPSWVQNGAQNRPSGAKKAQIELDGLPILAPNFQDRFPERSWVPFWLILDGFWYQLVDLLMNFGIHLAQRLIHYWRHFCGLLEPPTANRANGNRHEQADNY